MTIKHTQGLQWGAFKADGTLDAILSSESEAYFYIKNHGHMEGGSFRKVPAYNAAAPEFLAALESIALLSTDIVTLIGTTRKGADKNREVKHGIHQIAFAAIAKAKSNHEPIK